MTGEPFYHPPVKRSIEIAGHKTSISLEPYYWTLLRAVAASERLPVNALVARIDAERIEADPSPSLAGAIRLWLTRRAVKAPPDEPVIGDRSSQ